MITDRGTRALADASAKINNEYLQQFEEFRSFKTRITDSETIEPSESPQLALSSTPDENLRHAHKLISAALAEELLDRVRNASPAFFEQLIVDLLIAMGYGGTSEDAGRAIGQSGDNGVDGVIDQDPLGVDQIYIQAKRYKEGVNISAADIRDFFGALSLKKAGKGIFVTTSTFSPAATQTAKDLGSRIVLIDSVRLADLLIRYNVGCRVEEVLYLKRLDEEFFEGA